MGMQRAAGGPVGANMLINTLITPAVFYYAPITTGTRQEPMPGCQNNLEGGFDFPILERASAGRADERPGCEHDAGAGGVPGELREVCADHQSRSVVPGSDCCAYSGV